MPIIENKTDRLVFLRFNSGLTRHLAPREKVEVEHAEVKGNGRINRLVSKHVVAVQGTEKKKPPSRRRPKKKKKTTKPAGAAKPRKKRSAPKIS